MDLRCDLGQSAIRKPSQRNGSCGLYNAMLNLLWVTVKLSTKTQAFSGRLDGEATSLSSIPNRSACCLMKDWCCFCLGTPLRISRG